MKGDKHASEKEGKDENGQLGIISLFEKPNVRVITIVLSINWMLMNLGFYGLSLSSGSLSDNIFVSFFLVSLIGECQL